MKKYDLEYNIVKVNDKYDLYFKDNLTGIYDYIKTYEKEQTIKGIYDYIASIWDLKKYNVKLSFSL